MHIPFITRKSNHPFSVKMADKIRLMQLKQREARFKEGATTQRNQYGFKISGSSQKRHDLRELQHVKAQERRIRREHKLMSKVQTKNDHWRAEHGNEGTSRNDPDENAQKYIKRDKSYINNGPQQSSPSAGISNASITGALSNIGATKNGKNGHSKQEQHQQINLMLHRGGPTAPGPMDHLMGSAHKAGHHVLLSTLKPKDTNGSNFQPIDPHLNPNKPFSASMTHQGWLKNHPTFGRLLARLTGLLTKGDKLTPFAQGAVNKSNKIIPNRGIMKNHSINKLYGSAAKADQRPMGKQLGGNNLYHNQVAKANSQNYNPSNQPQAQPGQ